MPTVTGYISMQIAEQVLAAFLAGYNTAYTTAAPPTTADPLDCIESQINFNELSDYLTVSELSSLIPLISDVAVTIQYWNGTAWTDGIDSADTTLASGFTAHWNPQRQTIDTVVPHTLAAAVTNKYRLKVVVTQP